MTTHTATYSPEDDKLRLYPAHRLDADEYQKVKAAGFTWAPKQELFVAHWSPSREDLLIELAEEITDEDVSLVDRAEQRAERFEDYGGKRLQEAHAARAAVAAIADNIPFGQPILIGHHSEKRARRDAERIENGMRRAVSCWRTSQYWTDRAAGAIHAAKYKERPDVRARRIKKLEAELRKEKKTHDSAAKWIGLWERLHEPGFLPLKDGGGESTPEIRARFLANRDAVYVRFPVADYPRPDGASMWEGEQSIYSALKDGICSPDQAQEIALRVHRGTVERTDRWIEHLSNRLEYERSMLGEQGGTVTDRTKPEKGGAVRWWGSPGYGSGWSFITKVNKVSVSVRIKPEYGDRLIPTTVPLDKVKACMTAAAVSDAREAGRISGETDFGFYLHAELAREAVEHTEYKERVAAENAEAEQFHNLTDALKQGVQVVAAPTLFATPGDIAVRMASLLGLKDGDLVLEPSAGTGRLTTAVQVASEKNGKKVHITAVEINQAMAAALKSKLRDVRCADFLDCMADVGTFHRVIMNPPFNGGADIKHIRHALTFLRPGGRLVALCANGPRQREALQPLATHWEDLPEGSFREAGTNVNVALLVIDK